MKPEKISRELLMHTDFLNTIGGGMSMSVVNVNRNEDGYRVEASNPGISIDKMKVEIINQRLVIYHGIQVFGSEAFMEEDETHPSRIPYFIANLPIPVDADLEKITARQEKDKLVILAPFNNFSQGYRRQVEIDY